MVVAATVSILFQASIKRGGPPSSFGQLNGTLFNADSHEMVGFKAPRLQSLNTSECIGRIFIQYNPNSRLEEAMVLVIEAPTTNDARYRYDSTCT